MLRLGAGLAVLLLVPLAGCSSAQEEYCSALEEQQPALAELSSDAGRPGRGDLARMIGVFEGLQAKAPDDLVDEWDTYVTALKGLQTALADAGADESMFSDGRRPPGVSKADYEAISAAAVELRSTRVVAAAAGIENQARDVCKVDLDGSGLAP